MFTDAVTTKSTVEKAWEAAPGPNYADNVDLVFPYSEMPYYGDYDLLKIPVEGGLMDHVDYWGEGKINYMDTVRGFNRCYNVNEQFALVTRGPDEGKKIPNRIPVVSIQDCDTSGYTKDWCVHIVTVSTKPISKKCAADIARNVNSVSGMVVAFGYGYADTSSDIPNLSSALGKTGMFYAAGYEVPENLRFQTAFSTRRVFVDKKTVKDHLYYLVTGGDYINAVSTIRSLVDNGGSDVCRETIDKLVPQGLRNTMSLVYKLWTGNCQDVVKDYFPTEFRLIVDQQQIKFTSKHFNQTLILDSLKSPNGYRSTWGDPRDSSSGRVAWKLIPFWEDNHVHFKILNMEHQWYLALDVNVDEWGYGDRAAWGMPDSNEKRFTWVLYPVHVENQLLFLVENREYRQTLKLDSNVDKYGYGDRQVWGNNGNATKDPEYFGMIIRSWN